jgi:hypothetical protein
MSTTSAIKLMEPAKGFEKKEGGRFGARVSGATGAVGNFLLPTLKERQHVRLMNRPRNESIFGQV